MLAIEPKNTAVLVMDLQSEIVSMLGDAATPLLQQAARVIAAARKAKLPIVYIVVGFRSGYPEVSPRNASFSSVTKSGRFATQTPDIAATVHPLEGEVIVTKHRVGAFSGTDLEMILRAQGIDTLILFGLSTSGVVLSTVRQAADADYRLIVIKDACGDGDAEVHRVLTEKVFVRQATVTTADDVIAALDKI
ncbi:MAG TPA: isochorismatase family cysteine hydrolase [Polyangiales bacterium]|jgi:nicotinamidase-related amidase